MRIELLEGNTVGFAILYEIIKYTIIETIFPFWVFVKNIVNRINQFVGASLPFDASPTTAIP